jgi:hypothetical protein
LAAAGVAIGLAAFVFVLVYFQPQDLLINQTVNQAAASTTPPAPSICSPYGTARRH